MTSIDSNTIEYTGYYTDAISGDDFIISNNTITRIDSYGSTSYAVFLSGGSGSEQVHIENNVITTEDNFC